MDVLGVTLSTSPTPPRSQPSFSDESVVDDEDVTEAEFESRSEPPDPLNQTPPHPLTQTTYYDLYNRDEDFVELMKEAYENC